MTRAAQETESPLARMMERLQALDFDVTEPRVSSWPDVVATHAEKGIVVLDLADDGQDASVELNRKVAALRDAVPELARTHLHRRVIDCAIRESTAKILSLDDALSGAWAENLQPKPALPEALEALKARLAPPMTIELPQRLPLTDTGAGERGIKRIRLDEAQSSIARTPVHDVLALTGPPGSGKTLVLAARARWLADLHPDWNIQVLCFNRMLVPYLQALVLGFPNVGVSTFGRFASSLGYRVALDDEDRAMRDVERHLPSVRSAPVVDALLVDEWQDFFPAWTAFAVATVRPARGGTVLAGDPKQALYRDPSREIGLHTRSITRVELNKPYRSTRQILEVTSCLSESLSVESKVDALDGEPVDLVWADKPDQQAAAVARDVSLLLGSGERAPADIGILVTRKFQMGRLARELCDEGIPCRTIYANQADQLDLDEPVVKIMTVHSAKGLEFGVVFLVGLEHLPAPDGTPDVERQGRTGYVGTTRARDQLVMTYSKDNVYLERVRRLPQSVLRRWVWPDDYTEA